MSIWYTCENGSPEKPAEIDKTSSKVFNYIRKDFVEIPAQESEDEFMPGFGSAHWQYQEAKVRKKDWDSFVRSDVKYYLANQRYENSINEAATVIEPEPEETPESSVNIFEDDVSGD